MFRGKRKMGKTEPRINDKIRIAKVRLIDENGEQVGIVPTDLAKKRAKDLNLDLVEVSANARPPVCKIIDYGKFKYHQKKQDKNKKSNAPKLKEIQLRLNTGQHDIDHKIKHAREFLKEGHRVKIVMSFRGRELGQMPQGQAILEKLADQLSDVSVVDNKILKEGRRLALNLIGRTK